MSILICSLIRVLNRKRKKLWISEQEMRQVIWFITYVLVHFFTIDYVITMSIRNHARRRAKNIERFVERYSSGEQSYLYHITSVIIEAFTPDYLASNDALDSRVRSREALAIKWKPPLFRAPAIFHIPHPDCSIGESSERKRENSGQIFLVGLFLAAT